MPVSAQDVYARLLLPHRHGYPLWLPEPNQSLPPLVYEQGIQLGDVGLINDYGDFTTLFNIFLPRDHPVNMVHGVPEPFQPLEFRQSQLFTTDYHKGKAPIYSKHTKELRFGADGTVMAPTIPIGPGIGIELQFSRSQGAALMLPEAAVRTDYRGLPDVREYAEANAESWYQHLTDQVRMDAYNGCLYVITGLDKTHCYDNLSFNHYAKESAVSVRFSSPLLPNGDFGRFSLSYGSATTHTPLSGGSNSEHTLKNLSVFIRGFKVMLRRSRWAGRRSTIKLVDMKEADPKDVMYKGTLPSSSPQSSALSPASPLLPGSPPSESLNGSDGGSSNLSLHLASDSTSVTSWNSSDSEGVVDSGLSFSERGSSILDSESEQEDGILNQSWPYHPSDVINRHILKKFPHLPVAITHDEAWISVLRETDEGIPDDCILIGRVEDTRRLIWREENDIAKEVHSTPQHKIQGCDNLSALDRDDLMRPTDEDKRGDGRKSETKVGIWLSEVSRGNSSQLGEFPQRSRFLTPTLQASGRGDLSSPLCLQPRGHDDYTLMGRAHRHRSIEAEDSTTAEDDPTLKPQLYTPVKSFDHDGAGASAEQKEQFLGRNSQDLKDSDGDSKIGHVCARCSKRFNRPSSLRIHMNTHTDATPFPCPYPGCGRKFNLNSNMRHHYGSHPTLGVHQTRNKQASSGAELVSSRPALEGSLVPVLPRHIPHGFCNSSEARSKLLYESESDGSE